LAVPYRTALAGTRVRGSYTQVFVVGNILPEHPVLNIPPIVAVGAGSSFEGKLSVILSDFAMNITYGKE
jgi:hypothetical protein